MEKSKFTNLVETFAVQAKKDKWIPIYNKKLDYFTLTKKNTSEDARLIKISNGEYFLISSKGKIEGLAVEYLKTNFLEHNKGIEILPEFKKQVSDQEYTIAGNRIDKLNGFLQAVRADIWKEVCVDEKGKTSKERITELDNLIKVAIAV